LFSIPARPVSSSSFFFHHTATTVIYTLSLHDALPIYTAGELGGQVATPAAEADHAESLLRLLLPLSAVHPAQLESVGGVLTDGADRKSTRLNSSHVSISYAVFCLKKKQNYSLFVNVAS